MDQVSLPPTLEQVRKWPQTRVVVDQMVYSYPGGLAEGVIEHETAGLFISSYTVDEDDCNMRQHMNWHPAVAEVTTVYKRKAP